MCNGADATSGLPSSRHQYRAACTSRGTTPRATRRGTRPIPRIDPCWRVRAAILRYPPPGVSTSEIGCGHPMRDTRFAVLLGGGIAATLDIVYACLSNAQYGKTPLW